MLFEYWTGTEMNFVHVSTTTQNDELATFKFQNSNPNQYAILLPRSQIFI